GAGLPDRHLAGEEDDLGVDHRGVAVDRDHRVALAGEELPRLLHRLPHLVAEEAEPEVPVIEVAPLAGGELAGLDRLAGVAVGAVGVAAARSTRGIAAAAGPGAGRRVGAAGLARAVGGGPPRGAAGRLAAGADAAAVGGALAAAVGGAPAG